MTDRECAVLVLETIRKLPVVTGKRGFERAIRKLFAFEWRRCSCCECYMPLRFYHKDASRSNGRSRICGGCENLKAMLYYHRNPEKFRQQASQRRRNLPPKPFPGKRHGEWSSR